MEEDDDEYCEEGADRTINLVRPSSVVMLFSPDELFCPTHSPQPAIGTHRHAVLIGR